MRFVSLWLKEGLKSEYSVIQITDQTDTQSCQILRPDRHLSSSETQVLCFFHTEEILNQSTSMILH